MKYLNDNILEEVENWFIKFLSTPSDYHIVISGRCENLLEALTIREKDTNGPLHTLSKQNVLNDKGLLMHSEDIAKYYLTNGVFPKISIAENLLVHGRNLKSVLETFEDKVLNILSNNLNNDELIQAKYHLIANIYTKIFAESNGPALLPADYLWNLTHHLTTRDNENKEYSLLVSDLLFQTGIMNTTSTLSASTSNFNIINNNNWYVLNNQKGPQVFVLKDYLEKGIIPIIRVYNNDNNYKIIPHVFYNGCDRETANLISENIKDYVPVDSNLKSGLNTIYKKIKSLGDDNSIYGEFTNLLLSQVTLNLFIQDFKLNNENVSYDTNRTSRTLGGKIDNTDVSSVLNNLTHIKFTKELFNDIVNTIINSVEDMQIKYPDINENKRQKYIRAFENNLYERSVINFYHAVKLRDIAIGGWDMRNESVKKNNIDIYSLLRESGKNIGLSFDESYYLFIQNLPHIFTLLDKGMFHLQVNSINDKDTNKYQEIAITTPLSDLIIPKRLGADCFYVLAFFASLYGGDKGFDRLYSDIIKQAREQGLMIDDYNESSALEFLKMINDYYRVHNVLTSWYSMDYENNQDMQRILKK